MLMTPTELYLDLLKKSLTNTLFCEEPERTETPRFVYKFIDHYIKGAAITMLPAARLDNLQACVIDTIEQGVPGDLIETGVWRGGATIFMRAVLKAYGDRQRTVWVADSFQGFPKPNPRRY